MRTELFPDLPLPTALLVLASLISLTRPASASARPPVSRPPVVPKTTVSYQALNVIAWPPLPTNPPDNPFDDLRRREDTNTICGFIGGNPGLPATCNPGSHCVLDMGHNVLGCCPNGQEICTAGVFTGCVDVNSGPQTVVNPYVFTCTGASVCYKNVFDVGFSQFGCGTASNLATTVEATATGITASLIRPSVTVPFTESPSPLTSPTLSGSRPASNSATRTPTATSASSNVLTTLTTSLPGSTSLSATSTSSNSATGTATPAAPPASSSQTPDRTGAIVGGTISGAAVLVAIAGAGVFFRRRRIQGNARTGPGNLPPTRPARYQPGGGSGGDAVFSPLHQTSEAFEVGMPPGGAGYGYGYEPYGTSAAGAPIDPRVPYIAPYNAPGTHQSYPPPEEYNYPARQYPAAYALPGRTSTATSQAHHSRMAGDEIPLTREIDDFSRGFQDALGRIGEEDESGGASGGSSNEAVNEGNGINGGGGQYNGGNMRPLWQQNRRQSRSLMWV